MEVDGILNKNGIVNISNINIDHVLLNDFSDNVNEILGLPSTPDFVNETITAVGHK